MYSAFIKIESYFRSILNRNSHFQKDEKNVCQVCKYEFSNAPKSYVSQKLGKKDVKAVKRRASGRNLRIIAYLK